MLKTSEPAQLREELMVRLRAEAQLNENTIIPELENHLRIHQEKLNLYQTIFEKDFADQNIDNRTLYIHKMILQLGINMEREWIHWFNEIIPQLKQFNT